MMGEKEVGLWEYGVKERCVLGALDLESAESLLVPIPMSRSQNLNSGAYKVSFELNNDTRYISEK